MKERIIINPAYINREAPMGGEFIIRPELTARASERYASDTNSMPTDGSAAPEAPTGAPPTESRRGRGGLLGRMNPLRRNRGAPLGPDPGDIIRTDQIRDELNGHGESFDSGGNLRSRGSFDSGGVPRYGAPAGAETVLHQNLGDLLRPVVDGDFTTLNNKRVRGLVDTLKARRLNDVTAEEANNLLKEISDAAGDIEQYPGADYGAKAAAYTTEYGRIQSEVIDHLSRFVGQRFDYEREEARRKGEAYGDRYNYLKGVYKENGEEAKPDDILADAELRDSAFSRLFASADGAPHQFFNVVFDQLTDGAKYKDFVNFIRDSGYNDGKQLTDDIVENYATNNGIAIPDAPEAGDPPDVADRKNEQRARAINGVRETLKQELLLDYQKYTQEYQLRERLHNANALIELPNVQSEQVWEYIQQFGADILDSTNRIHGIKEMKDIYEEVLREIMFENDGYLKPDLVQTRTITEEYNGRPRKRPLHPEARTRTIERFKERVRSGMITLHVDGVAGKQLTIDHTKFHDFDYDRIYSWSRAAMLMDMRLLSIAAESKLPKGGEYSSLYLQPTIQYYDINRHLLMKYKVPSAYVLAAMLDGPDSEKWFDLIHKPWFPKDILDLVHLLRDDHVAPQDILDGKFGEDLQIRRQSMGMIGDAWSFLSGYRVTESVEKATVSASKDYLEYGEARMKIFTGQSAADHGHTRWDAVAQLYDSLEPAQKAEYLNEYGSWVGTGMRFERIRDEIRAGNEAAIAQGKQMLARIVELQPGRIFLKSSKIQERMKRPENERFNAIKGRMPNVLNNLHFLEQQMYRMRDDLIRDGYTFDGRLEGAVGRDRFTLMTIYDRLQAQWAPQRAQIDADPNLTDQQKAERKKELGIVLPSEGDWEATRQFMTLMQEDFTAYADHEGHTYKQDIHGYNMKMFATEEEGYYQEFMYNRDFNHGFVLWTGDAPWDEFNFTSAGATAAVIRRAGENNDVEGANKAYVEFLGHLYDFGSVDDVYQALIKVYAPIASYDYNKAKEITAALAEAAIKFYRATGPANVPILGELLVKSNFLSSKLDALGKIPGVGKIFKGKGDYTAGSLSQRLFNNKKAMIWHAKEIRDLVNDKLHNHGKITDAQRDELFKHVNARSIDVGLDVVSDLGPIVALAIMIYIISEASDDV